MRNSRLIVCLIVITFIVTLFTGCLSTTSSPEEVAQEFLNAIVEGDVQTYEESLMPHDSNVSNSMKELGRGATNLIFGSQLDGGTYESLTGALMAWLYSGTEYKVTGSTINDSKAMVTFDTYQDGTYTGTAQIPLSKYKGKWYIDFSGYTN